LILAGRVAGHSRLCIALPHSVLDGIGGICFPYVNKETQEMSENANGPGFSFIFAIVAAAIGWLFTSAASELKDLRLVEYSIAYEPAPAGRVANVRFHNRSAFQPLDVGKFGFECRSSNQESDCFANLPNKNRKAEFFRIGTITLSSQPQRLAPHLMQVDARIPPRSSIGYRFGLNHPGAKLNIQYDLSSVDLAANNNIRVSVQEGRSIEGFVIANYVVILLGMLAAFVLAFVILFVIAILPSRKPKAGSNGGGNQEPGDQPESFIVEVRGEKIETTVTRK
jgi:hypothetical protein